MMISDIYLQPTPVKAKMLVNACKCIQSSVLIIMSRIKNDNHLLSCQ